MVSSCYKDTWVSVKSNWLEFTAARCCWESPLLSKKRSREFAHTLDIWALPLLKHYAFPSSSIFFSCRAIFGRSSLWATVFVWAMHQFVSSAFLWYPQKIRYIRCTPGHEIWVLSFMLWKCHSHRSDILLTLSQIFWVKKNNKRKEKRNPRKNYSYVLEPPFRARQATLQCRVAVWAQPSWYHQSWSSFPGLPALWDVPHPLHSGDGYLFVLFTSIDVINEANKLRGPKTYLMFAREDEDLQSK